MSDVGNGRFGILISAGRDRPYKLWYKLERDREKAYARLKTNKKLDIKRIQK